MLPNAEGSWFLLLLGGFSWLYVTTPQHHGKSCIHGKMKSSVQRRSGHQFSKVLQSCKLRQRRETRVTDLKWKTNFRRVKLSNQILMLKFVKDPERGGEGDDGEGDLGSFFVW